MLMQTEKCVCSWTNSDTETYICSCTSSPPFSPFLSLSSDSKRARGNVSVGGPSTLVSTDRYNYRHGLSLPHHPHPLYPPSLISRSFRHPHPSFFLSLHPLSPPPTPANATLTPSALTIIYFSSSSPLQRAQQHSQGPCQKVAF